MPHSIAEAGSASRVAPASRLKPWHLPLHAAPLLHDFVRSCCCNRRRSTSRVDPHPHGARGFATDAWLKTALQPHFLVGRRFQPWRFAFAFVGGVSGWSGECVSLLWQWHRHIALGAPWLAALATATLRPGHFGLCRLAAKHSWGNVGFVVVWARGIRPPLCRGVLGRPRCVMERSPAKRMRTCTDLPPPVLVRWATRRLGLVVAILCVWLGCGHCPFLPATGAPWNGLSARRFPIVTMRAVSRV